MNNIQTIDTNAYVTVKGNYAVVNEGAGYAIINTQTKTVSARNITSFLDCVKTLEYILGNDSPVSSQTDQPPHNVPVEPVIEVAEISNTPAHSPTHAPSPITSVGESAQIIVRPLGELDLAALLSFVTYFNDMSGKICRHHQDHHASSEEAEIIASYYRKTARRAAQVETEEDLIKFIEHIKQLKQTVSRYQHDSHKYRWSTGLEKVLNKLQRIMDALNSSTGFPLNH